MKTFNIQINSKSQKAIEYFSLFFNNYLFYSSNNTKKCSLKKIKKIKIALLKSPHVNKKSQEQFEVRFFKKKIMINTKKSLQYFIFFKKLSNSSYANISVKIKQILINKNQFKVLNSNCLKIKILSNKITKLANFEFKKPLNLLEKIKVKCCVAKKTNLILSFFELSGECFKIMFK